MADRTPKVVARNANIPEVVNIGTKVVPLAGAYVASHEALKEQRVTTRRALQVGRAEIAALRAGQQLWRIALARDLPGFERAELNASASDPDGQLAEALHVVSLVRKDGGELSYATMLVDEVTALRERAELAWSVAQSELKKQQMLQGELRSIGAQFLRELVLLRAALRVRLGSHDRDYRALQGNPPSEDPEVEELDAADAPAIAAKRDGTS